MPDDQAQMILAPLQVDNSLKADAWEAFNKSASENELGVRLQSINLPQQTKADLWEAKHKIGSQQPNLVTGAGMEAQAQQQAKQVLTGTGEQGFYNEQGRKVSGPSGQPLTYMEKAAQDLSDRQTRLGAAMNRAQQSPMPITNATLAADLPQLGAGIINKIPSISRAAAGFADVAGTVGTHTIDVSKVGNVALETKQLAEAGGRMPKVINDFLRRVTDPDKAAITYNEARNFYTNATKLSADEFSRLNPVMRRQAAQFVQELGNALSETAARGNKAEVLKGAISEYSNAMKMRTAAKTIGKGILTGAGAYGGYEVLKNLLPKITPTP